MSIKIVEELAAAFLVGSVINKLSEPDTDRQTQAITAWLFEREARKTEKQRIENERIARIQARGAKIDRFFFAFIGLPLALALTIFITVVSLTGN